MSKAKVLDAILDALRSEFETFKRASEQSRGGGSDAEARSDGKYDTRSTEANYLADGQAMQAEGAAQAIRAFEALDPMQASSVGIGSLVEVKMGNGSEWFFFGPASGGLEVACDGAEITVITPDSVLGGRLHGLKSSDRIESPPCEVVSVR